MSALTFKLRSIPAQTIDLALLSPDRLSGKNAKEIAAIRLVTGNRKMPVGELFDVSGDDAANVIVAGACDKLDRIAFGMTGGTVTVEGDAGAYLGMGMTGGRISVAGNAGAWLGSGMLNGTIHVRGNAGDFLAAAIPGDKQGMLGGTIVVEGNAGDRVGDHLRRGMVLIKGNTGEYCAARMLAGTIMVGGALGGGAGFGMKRGTLLLSREPKALLPTFNDCGVHHLSFLNLLHGYLRGAGAPMMGFAASSDKVRRYVGDLANSGNGEILLYAD